MKRMLKGNEAIAEAALRAGMKFYTGYPITPQTEVMEYLSWRMPELGRTFIQASSEIEAINMIFGAAATGMRCLTSSCGPGMSLKQEGISYIALNELPCVILNVQRWGPGLGSMASAQTDYSRETRGGGNGDYRQIVYAPNSIQESVDLMYDAFDISEKYRNPVLILSEGSLGQMVEACELPEFKEGPAEFDWTYTGKYRHCRAIDFDLMPMYDVKHTQDYMQKKHKEIRDNEQKWETYMIEDAEYILCAFGLTSRVVKESVKMLREKGEKAGMIRPITLWPFPVKAFEEVTENTKGFICIEGNDTGQMIEDVAIASKVTRNLPIYLKATGQSMATTAEIIEMYDKVKNKEVKEVF